VFSVVVQRVKMVYLHPIQRFYEIMISSAFKLRWFGERSDSLINKTVEKCYPVLCDTQ